METAMSYCEGDIAAADYMMNCSLYEWYYRLRQKAIYSQKVKEQMKNQK